MNRKTDDPSHDYTEFRKNTPWCVDHHNQLQDIWMALRGNGHPEEGLMWKMKKIEERQTKIYEFVQKVQSIFWKALPVCVLGAFSAIWTVLEKLIRLLIEHGKI